MQTFKVTFTRNPVVVLILLVIPLVAVAIILPLFLSIPNLPDWSVFVVAFAMIGIGLGGVILTLKKWGSIPATVAMDERGINIRLLRWSPFYPRKEYSSTWEGVENVSTNFDPQHDKRFYLVSFRRPATTVSLDPGDIANADSETPFGTVLLGYVEQYNEAHKSRPETVIHERGFYDSWWAKLLTVFSYGMCLTALILYFKGDRIMPGWRLTQVLCFSIMWLIAFHLNRRKKAKA